MAADPMRRVYIHVGLQSFVESSGGLFIAGFLVSQGFSNGMALAAFAGTLLARFALRGLVLSLAWRAGLRTVVLAGVLVRVVSFLLLPLVPGVGPVPAAGMLALFILVTGLGSVLYWTGWHSFVSALADSDRGGRQVSIQQATTAVVGIVAPLVGGVLVDRAGPMIGFGTIALVQLAAVLPLIGAPNPHVAREAMLDRQLTAFARRLYLSEGFHAGCATVIWNLALFVTLGQHFDAFGGALAPIVVVESDGSYRLLDVLAICEEGATHTGFNLTSHPLRACSDFARTRYPEPHAACQQCEAFAACGGGYVAHRFDGRSYDNPSFYCHALLGFYRHVRARVQGVTSPISLIANPKG